MPLGRAGTRVTVKLEARIGNGVHAESNGFKTRNEVADEIVGVARGEAMVVVPIGPVTRLQHLRISLSSSSSTQIVTEVDEVTSIRKARSVLVELTASLAMYCDTPSRVKPDGEVREIGDNLLARNPYRKRVCE